MSFSSFGYFALLPACALVYFLVPRRLQTAVLAAASLIFLCRNLPSGPQAFVPLAALAAVTLGSYAVARALPSSRHKKALLSCGIGAALAFLAFFKYYNGAVQTLFRPEAFTRLALPLGVSFYTFAVIGYLVDVSRGDVQPEENLLRYFVFTGFFATITSGPICRAGQLLPQLKKEHRFDAARTVNALRLFALGLFKKVAVSDLLTLYVNEVFRGYAGHGALSLMLAAALYSLALYFDFCGYSEMARASALLLGIDLPENFKTPYYATNFSGFWARWHISLSSWLQDYLFMPLVWGRWTSHLPFVGRHIRRPPTLLSLFIVFFLSGFWHGSTWPFVVWGLLQAAYRVGEELLHQKLGKPKKKARPALILAKRAGVFVLWSYSLIFFKLGSIARADGTAFSAADGFAYTAGLFRGFSPARFAAEFVADIRAGFYNNPIMVAAWLGFTVLCLALAFRLDAKRNKLKNKPAELVLAAQKPAVRWCVYYALVVAILAGLVIQNGGFAGASFAYANF